MLPRLIPLAAVAGILLVAALLLSFPARTSIAGATAATALLVVAAVAARGRGRSVRPTGLWVFAVAAVLVTAVTVPALASVQDVLIMDADGTVPAIPGHAGH